MKAFVWLALHATSIFIFKSLYLELLGGLWKKRGVILFPISLPPFLVPVPTFISRVTGVGYDWVSSNSNFIHFCNI